MTAQYPLATPTLIGLYEPKNNQINTTDQILGVGETTIDMLDTVGLPASGYLTFIDGTNEIIFFTSKSGTQLLGVTRGADGSSAQPHANGANVEMRWNADYHVRQNEEIIEIGTDLRNAFNIVPNDSAGVADVASSIKDRSDMYATRIKQIISNSDWLDAVTRPLNTVNADVLTRVSKSGDTMTGNLVMSANSDILLNSEESQLLFQDAGSNIVSMGAPGTIVSSYIFTLPTAQGGANTSIFNDGSGNLSFGLIANANVDGSAGISLNKLASVTVSRALESDGSGFIIASSITATELGHLNNISSNIQTQLDSMVEKTGDTMTGSLTFADSSDTIILGDDGANSATIKVPSAIGTSYTITLENGVAPTNSVWRWAASGQANWNLIENINIDGSAGIAFSKMATVTINRALESDGSGFIIASATTATELGHLSGVSSAIQTQLNGKLNNNGDTITGNLIFSANTVNAVWTDSGINTVSLSAPTNISSSYTLDWPTAQSSGPNFLRNDGSGNLSWTSPAGSGTVNGGTIFEIAHYPATADAVSGLSSIKTNAGGDLLLTGFLSLSEGVIAVNGIRFATRQTGLISAVTDTMDLVIDSTNVIRMLNRDSIQINTLTGGTAFTVLGTGTPKLVSVINGFGLSIQNGTLADPGLQFTSRNTGLASTTQDHVEIISDGVEVADFFNTLIILSTNTQITRTASGVNTNLLVRNLSNTASSGSHIEIVVGGTSAGDPITSWGVVSGSTWTAGIDNTDGDRWKLNNSTSLAVGSTLEITLGNQILGLNGTNTVPTWSFINATGIGLFRSSSISLGLSCGNNGNFVFFEGGTEVMRYDGGANALNPGADNTFRLGTDPGGRWSDVRAVLINGADIGFANGWAMREYPCTYEDVQEKSTKWMRANAWKGIQTLNKLGVVVSLLEHDGMFTANGFKTFDGFDVVAKVKSNSERIVELEKQIKELKEVA